MRVGIRAIMLCLAWFSVTASAQEIQVTLLGTGTPGPYPDRAGPATLVQAGDQVLLFDAGRNVVVRLWQDRIPVRDIHAVFLTHFHHDHFNGLADLWLTGWIGADYGLRAHPMRLIGPVGTQTVADGLELAYSRNREIRVVDEGLPEAGARFAVQEFEAPRIVYEQGDVVVKAFPVSHGEHITPAVGYRVDYAGLSVLISGDTTYDERLVQAAEGVDLLVHEVMAWDETAMRTVPTATQIAAHHTSPEEAGRLFTLVQPGMAAYSHLVLRGVTPEELAARTRTSYQGPLAIGEDRMRFLIGAEGVQVLTPGRQD